MTYDLLSSLNNGVALLIGIAVTVIAFSAVVPPSSPGTRRPRVMSRMVRDVLAAHSIHLLSFPALIHGWPGC